MLDIRIADGCGHGVYTFNKKFKDGINGLVVATRPYNHYEFKRIPFSSSAYGINMNIGAEYGDTPELVHDGIDSTLWTGSNIVGRSPTFNSTGRAYSGTRSIYWNNPTQGSIFQLSKGSNFTFNDHVAITMWINVDKDYENADLISFYGYNSTTGNQVGTKIYLHNYFSNGTNDVWQKITIPLADMNISGLTINSFRFNHENRQGPKSPVLYLDAIQVEQKADDQGLFIVKPEIQSWFFCEEIMFFISDVYNPGAYSNGVSLQLDYKKILNEPMLDSGIDIKVKRRSLVKYQINFKNLGQFLQLGGRIGDIGYDGVSETWMTLILPFNKPILLQHEYEDVAELNINDNLSGLTSLSCTARGYIEYKIEDATRSISVY